MLDFYSIERENGVGFHVDARPGMKLNLCKQQSKTEEAKKEKKKEWGISKKFYPKGVVGKKERGQKKIQQCLITCWCHVTAAALDSVGNVVDRVRMNLLKLRLRLGL